MKRFGWFVLVLLGAVLTWKGRVIASGITQSAYNLIENAGSALFRRTTLNFTGSGISCADDGTNNRTTCTVSGSSGSFGGVNVQTSNYTLQASDSGLLVVMNCSSSCAATMYGSPTSAFSSAIISIGSTLATVSLNSLDYNGTTSAPLLTTGQILYFGSNGTNYFGNMPFTASTNVAFTPSNNNVGVSSTGGGGGGASITVGSFTAQTCSSSAFIFVANNSPINFFCDGSSHGLYKYRGVIITPFSTSDTAWFNQTSATIGADTAGAGIVLTGTASGSSNTQGRIKSVPSTPYVQIGCFEPQALSAATAFPAVGLLWTNGTGTGAGIIEVQAVTITNSGPVAIAVGKRTGVTGSASNYSLISGDVQFGGGSLVCEGLQDDGTTRKVAHSFNKSDWYVDLSVSDTDFITPTEIGYFVNSLNSDTIPSMHLADWETVSGTLF